MHITRIEIQGFKSFARRTVFDLNGGLTGIVGPNGSGKSNLLEAIRWAVGESQAKHLRTASAADLLFHGTTNLPKAQVAEVAIVCNNEDGRLTLDEREIILTRRLYRHGEGEYRINGKKVLRREFAALLLDTGLLTEGYNVISQGRIDRILSMQPIERRQLIDEAASLATEQEKRNALDRELTSLTELLIRLHDTLQYRREQTDQLYLASERALKYRELAEQLRSNEGRLLTQQILQMQQEQTTSAVQLRQAQAMLKQLKAKKQELQALENGFVANPLATLKEQVHDRFQQRELLDQQEHVLLREQQAYEEQMNLTLGQMVELKGHIQADHDRLDQLNQKIGHQETFLSTQEPKWLAEVTQELFAAQRKNEEFLVLQARYTSDFERAELTEAEIRDALAKWQFSQKEGAKVQALIAQQMGHIGARKARNKRWLSRWECILAHLMEEQEKLQINVQEQQTSLQQTKVRMHTFQAKYETLQAIVAAGEGHGRGVNLILQAQKKGILHGIAGTVADLALVPEPFWLAVETALGGAASHLVTDETIAAENAIAYLKKQGGGRATLLPMDRLRIRPAMRLPSGLPPRIHGLAAHLIRFVPPYGALAEHLLGHVLVAETLEAATAASRQRDFSQGRFVTLDGDLVAQDGSLTGGSREQKRQGLRVGRRGELEGLQRQIHEEEQQHSTMLSAIEDLQASIQHYALQKKRVQAILAQCTEDAANLAQKWLELEAKEINWSLQSSQSESERTALEHRLTTILAEQKRLTAQLEDTEQARQATVRRRQELSEKQQGLQLAQEKVNLAREEVKRLQEERAVLLARHQTMQLQQDALCRQQSTLQEKMDRVQPQLQQLQTEKAQFQLGEIGLQTARRALREYDVRYESFGRVYHRLLLGKEKLIDQLSSCLATEMAVEARLMGHLESLEEKESSLKRMLHDEWGFADLQEGVGRSSTSKQLKEQIAALGAVDSTAPTRYEAESKQLKTDEEEFNALQQAKLMVEKQIEIVAQTMERKFTQAYDLVSEQFALSFADLFGGGQAMLVLDENKGIDLICEPPGKKKASLSLLSGGERTLAALAFLFALFQVKPSPFYLFDEVEAALDEVNALRFANFLRRHRQGQFLVITHRPSTMEAMERIYGITQGEKGVSTVVSVRLEQAIEVSEGA